MMINVIEMKFMPMYEVIRSFVFFLSLLLMAQLHVTSDSDVKSSHYSQVPRGRGLWMLVGYSVPAGDISFQLY